MDTVVIARVNLRALARQLEESAVLLEEAGHIDLPHELRAMSMRLVRIREALELRAK